MGLGGMNRDVRAKATHFRGDEGLLQMREHWLHDIQRLILVQKMQGQAGV